MNIGIIGLAVMGQNIARNIESRGYSVSVYNRTFSKTEKFIDEYGSKTMQGFETLEKFVASLKTPRKVLVMVKAGAAVDAVLKQLIPLLDKKDIVIDGGNEWYKNTIHREKVIKEQGIHFMGCGISGGEEGALHGPSMMPGGTEEAWQQVQPIFEAIAAKDFDDGACVMHIGTDGAGHFVKMVHNGIEYAIMQMIAEAYQLLKDAYQMTPADMADVFIQFNQGRLSSFLFEIAIPILQKQDADGTSLLEKILDTAGQKGTGRWTGIEALSLGVEASTIVQAVHARVSSSQKEQRIILAEHFQKPQLILPTLSQEHFITALEAALYGSILVSYSQGYELIQAAAKEYSWNINLSEVTRIWQGGCIIRAEVLKTLQQAFLTDPNKHLLTIDSIQNELSACLPHMRSVVSIATQIGVPVYCLGSALTSFESATSARTSANMIQGLRDFFGAHTYQRIDIEGIFHTEWGK